jgi:hypothetical protein
MAATALRHDVPLVTDYRGDYLGGLHPYAETRKLGTALSTRRKDGALDREVFPLGF